MEIDKLSEMGIDSVRAASLADATPVPVQVSGMTLMRLKNQRTGEYLISFCSAHRSYDSSCPACHSGVWTYIP